MEKEKGFENEKVQWVEILFYLQGVDLQGVDLQGVGEKIPFSIGYQFSNLEQCDGAILVHKRYPPNLERIKKSSQALETSNHEIRHDMKISIPRYIT